MAALSGIAKTHLHQICNKALLQYRCKRNGYIAGLLHGYLLIGVRKFGIAYLPKNQEKFLPRPSKAIGR